MTTVDVFDSPANATDGIEKIGTNMKNKEYDDNSGFISAWREFKSAADSSRRERLKQTMVHDGSNSTRYHGFEQAKAKLATWQKMAQDLEHVAHRQHRHHDGDASPVDQGVTRGVVPTTKSVGQLRREILALRSDSKRRDVDLALVERARRADSYDSLEKSNSKMSATIRMLESKVARYASKVEKRDVFVEELKTEISTLQDKLVSMAAELKDTRVKKERAEREAEHSMEELEIIKASLDRESTSMQALREDVENAQIAADQAEARASTAEELMRNEKNRRLELEQRLVDVQDSFQSLELQLSGSKKKHEADVEDFRAEFDALHREMNRLQREALSSKKYAAEKAESLIAVMSERDDAVSSQRALHLELDQAKAEIESYRHRVDVAEEIAAEATAECRKLKAHVSINSEQATELKALQQVLQSVTASAQMKDKELVHVTSKYEEAKLSWASEKAKYEDEIETLRHTCKEQESVVNHLEHRADTAERLYNESAEIYVPIIIHEEKTPGKLREREERRVQQALDALREKMAMEMEQQNNRHMEAVGELETVHTLQLRKAMEASHKNQEKIAELEDVLIQKQEEVDKLTSECNFFKNKFNQALKRAEAAEEEATTTKKQMQKAKSDLLEAQDEVEALLTARVEALSRANSVVDADEEEWLFNEQDLALKEISKEQKKKSPIKKLAAYMRRKTKSPTKQRKLEMP
ncbi:hypothetical protein M9434_001778 [Picochlorum sp. BPE23]|nr:hypothetical protein M9434_001778 [Picochlorum sp. BPE23]